MVFVAYVDRDVRVLDTYVAKYYRGGLKLIKATTTIVDYLSVGIILEIQDTTYLCSFQP